MLKKGFFIFIITLLALVGSSIFSIPKAEAVNYTYNYSIVYQSPYPSTLKPGDTTNVSLEIKNTGTATWKSTGDKIVRLGSGSSYGFSNQGRDYASEFANYDWLSRNRPTNISKTEVKPGDTAVFRFNIKVPESEGTYKAYFTPVVDGYQWMKDQGIYWQISAKGGLSTSVNTLYSSNEVASQFAPSVVKIFTRFNADYYDQGSGTLLFNSRNDPRLPTYYVITNRHILETEDGSTPKSAIKVTPDYNNPNYYFIFKSEGYKNLGSSADFAILEPTLAYGNPNAGSYADLAKYATSDSSLIARDLYDERVGEAIVVIGYPNNNNETFSYGSFLGYEFYDGMRYMHISAPLSVGNSGGLAVDYSGHMLGIPTFLKPDGSGLVLDIDYVLSKIGS